MKFQAYLNCCGAYILYDLPQPFNQKLEDFKKEFIKQVKTYVTSTGLTITVLTEDNYTTLGPMLKEIGFKEVASSFTDKSRRNSYYPLQEKDFNPMCHSQLYMFVYENYPVNPKPKLEEKLQEAAQEVPF